VPASLRYRSTRSSGVSRRRKTARDDSLGPRSTDARVRSVSTPRCICLLSPGRILRLSSTSVSQPVVRVPLVVREMILRGTPKKQKQMGNG